jgi:hypothetical protein
MKNCRSDQRRRRNALADAGLLDISPHDFHEKVVEAKRFVIDRLSELVKGEDHPEERYSLAYSLGALKNVEENLQPEMPSRKPRRDP